MRSPARSSRTRASFPIAMMFALFTPHALIAWEGDEGAPPQTYTTEPGELRRVILGQHAVANLNTRTVLRVERTPNGCDITLENGEALFDIRRRGDAGSLRITAGNVSVRADAAAFSMRLRSPDRADVLVRKGAVTLAAANVSAIGAASGGSSVDLTNELHGVTLVANYKANVSPAGVAVEEFSESETLRQLEWTTGYLSFRGETLEEVVEEFNRYNSQRLVIEDRAIRQLRISGKFLSTDPEGFAAALRPMGVQRVVSRTADARGDLIRLIGTRGQ